MSQTRRWRILAQRLPEHGNADSEIINSITLYTSTIGFTMPFDFVHSISTHLAVHASDRALNPPPAYLFVQDALVIFTGVNYALCYMLYIVRTRRGNFVVPSLTYSVM